MTYEKMVLETFLEKQGQLFEEPVAESIEDADDFLCDCMAQVFQNIKEVRKYFDEAGIDLDGVSDAELSEELEVMELPDGRYLVVEA